jgi:hypothetical protein
MRFKLAFLAASLSVVAISSPASAQAITNVPFGTDGNVGSVGRPDTQTYGQVFTAQSTGILTSFTLYLNGTIGNLFGGVGTWNGTASFGTGFGSPTNLFQSATQASVAGANTFNPNIQVVAGQRYVAYLSVFGVPGAIGQTSMQLATNDNVAGIDYFVYQNSADPRGDATWNYNSLDRGDALFTAQITPGAIGAVPEPATWAMMIGGFGIAGVALRRRRKAMVSYA